MRTLIAGIDPGLVTGLAVWDTETGKLNGMTGELAPSLLYEWLYTSGNLLQAVQCEFFTISSRTIKTKVDYNALHLIGAIKFAAYFHGFELAFSNPDQVKSTFPDAALKQAGMLPKAQNGHARDAARHLARYLVMNKIKPVRDFLLA